MNSTLNKVNDKLILEFRTSELPRKQIVTTKHMTKHSINETISTPQERKSSMKRTGSLCNVNSNARYFLINF